MAFIFWSALFLALTALVFWAGRISRAAEIRKHEDRIDALRRALRAAEDEAHAQKERANRYMERSVADASNELSPKPKPVKRAKR